MDGDWFSPRVKKVEQKMEPAARFELRFLEPGSSDFASVVALASSVLKQDRYLVREYSYASESHVIGAFDDDRAVGFLRFLIQQPGAEEQRTPIQLDGKLILEAYVEAFGVEPGMRRLGIGTALQETAISYARQAGCYQIRSQSPISSMENYLLKLAAGYAVHPAHDTDSYFFILKL